MTPIRSTPVRPRSAASLVLLRDGANGVEALLGRRGGGARFMPGMFVFPGGRVSPSDARPWRGERPPSGPEPSGLRCRARAALRETWEETGLLVGLAGAPPRDGADPRESEVEAAYGAAGLAPAVHRLLPFARAITPTRSPMRFRVQFFLADGALAMGDLRYGHELEDVAWHSLAAGLPEPMSDVTQFMVRQAVSVWTGATRDTAAFYRYVGGRPRIGLAPLAVSATVLR